MTTQAQTLPRLAPHAIYALDAVVSCIMGIGLIVAAEPLAVLAGWPLPSAALAIVGLLLLPWAAFNAWIARHPAPPRAVVLGNIAGDIVWVTGSIVLIAAIAPSLTATGLFLLIGQAVAVALVGVVKLAGARALTA